MSKKPVLLCIMDGFGKNPDTYGNAIAAAKKPNLDRIFAENPMTYIGASGLDVGLPDGQMGNSEAWWAGYSEFLPGICHAGMPCCLRWKIPPCPFPGGCRARTTSSFFASTPIASATSG